MKEDGIQYYRVIVEDNGPGIPDELKNRIFNRLHKGSTKGMGLGLYLVKTLVDSYDGRVWVEDRVHGDYTKGADSWSCYQQRNKSQKSRARIHPPNRSGTGLNYLSDIKDAIHQPINLKIVIPFR